MQERVKDVRMKVKLTNQIVDDEEKQSWQVEKWVSLIILFVKREHKNSKYNIRRI
jgi:hypothetical protein